MPLIISNIIENELQGHNCHYKRDIFDGGWLFDVARLEQVLPAVVAMKSNAARAFLASSHPRAPHYSLASTGITPIE